jgi:hypothetical protein
VEGDDSDQDAISIEDEKEEEDKKDEQEEKDEEDDNGNEEVENGVSEKSRSNGNVV